MATPLQKVRAYLECLLFLAFIRIQQHDSCSTCTRCVSLGSVVTEASLAEALAGCFAVEDSPIWADGSTEEYASELEEALGGAARLAGLTGSRAHLRQGAPQIMKVRSSSFVDSCCIAGRGSGVVSSRGSCVGSI